MGLPLVSTNVSGIPELVRQGHSGFLVPPEASEALAEALATLAADRALRTALGQNARALVETKFDIKCNARSLRELLMTLSASQPLKTTASASL